MKKKLLTIACIPAYNEDKTIAGVILLANKHVDKVIVCDDGSTDMTALIAENLNAEVVRHEYRMGYGATIQTLFRRAKELNADVMVTLDADGQHDPEDIPKVTQPIMDRSSDLVIGSRFLEETNEEVPPYRRFGINVITKLAGKAAGDNFSDSQSGFRAYGKKAIDNLALNEDHMGISAEILLKAKKQGLRITETAVACRYKDLETSTHGPLIHGADVIMSIIRLVVEDRPLFFLGIPGFISLLIGTVFGVWLLRIYTIQHRMVTNIALASIVFILIGFFAIFTAITLYAILRLTKKLTR
jgi:glycosyltransferase involved in cell wall biosynthesis